jgi:pyruvate,water dikinase
MRYVLSGKTAAAGFAEGRAVVVTDEADLDKVGAGDILVAAQTDVEYVPAMLRASAVVTETGGRFCHAAVWARENSKPTVLQVPDATSLLDGVAVVSVDATAGTVTWEADA